MDRSSFKGISVSNGIGIGEIHVFEQQDQFKKQASYITLDNETSDKSILLKDSKAACEYSLEIEISKLNLSFQKTFEEISDLKEELKTTLTGHDISIFDVYCMILKDIYFIGEVKEVLKAKECSSEEAVHVCMSRYIGDIINSGNAYAIGRICDLNDLEDKIKKNIRGGAGLNTDKVNSKQIIVTKELTPSLAAMLGKKNVAGIVSKKGAGYLSHAAIILRSIGIPTLNGLDFDEIRKFNGALSIIDSQEGFLVINPQKQELEKYRLILQQSVNRKEQIVMQKVEPPVTKDGHRVGLYSNISNLEEFMDTRNKNLDGIGLLRTEMLFIGSRRIPNEKSQFLIYSRVARSTFPKPVVIRTLDIGEDKELSRGDEKPELLNRNLRGLELSLAQKDQFLVQLRSILRASQYGNVSIAFPMVNNADQIVEAKDMMKLAASQLAEEYGTRIKKIEVGAFIETTMGVGNLDSIIDHVDFICIGSNDLLQQTMGIDRRTTVEGEVEYLDPEFLKILQYCISRSNRKNKSICICGEMAADPIAAIILMGMGTDSLSMSPSKAVEISNIIRKTSIADAWALSTKVIDLVRLDDVKGLVTDWFRMW
jgi:phosphoenolpyruvate-protein phosphotransferase (PTS system enzyme I)